MVSSRAAMVGTVQRWSRVVRRWLFVPILHLFFFNCQSTGKRDVTAGNEEEEPQEIYLGVPCRKAEKVGGYNITQDDPAVFCDQITYVDHPRDLTEPYPDGADQEQTVPQASTSASQEDPVPGPKAEMVAMLSRMHYELSKLAKNAGVADICATEKANRLENVIAGLTSKDLICRYCKKKYSSITKLKNHLKVKHLKKTAHYCEPCKKYFSEASSLLAHRKRHEEGAQEFRCKGKVKDKDGNLQPCQKVCYSAAKLRDHQIVHSSAKPFTCQYCQAKSFKRKKSVKEHEAKCINNPNYGGRLQCRLCPKNYADKKSLQRHFRSSHPGEDPDL